MQIKFYSSLALGATVLLSSESFTELAQAVPLENTTQMESTSSCDGQKKQFDAFQDFVTYHLGPDGPGDANYKWNLKEAVRVANHKSARECEMITQVQGLGQTEKKSTAVVAQDDSEWDTKPSMLLAQVGQTDVDQIGAIASIAAAIALMLKTGLKSLNGGDKQDLEVAAEQLESKATKFKTNINETLNKFQSSLELKQSKSGADVHKDMIKAIMDQLKPQMEQAQATNAAAAAQPKPVPRPIMVQQQPQMANPAGGMVVMPNGMVAPAQGPVMTPGMAPGMAPGMVPGMAPGMPVAGTGQALPNATAVSPEGKKATATKKSTDKEIAVKKAKLEFLKSLDDEVIEDEDIEGEGIEGEGIEDELDEPIVVPKKSKPVGFFSARAKKGEPIVPIEEDEDEDADADDIDGVISIAQDYGYDDYDDYDAYDVAY